MKTLLKSLSITTFIIIQHSLFAQTTGPTGATGPSGLTGGVTIFYTWATPFVSGGVSSGIIVENYINTALDISLGISNTDMNGNDQTNFLAQIIPGSAIEIFDITNPNIFATYTYLLPVNGVGQTYAVTYLSGSGTFSVGDVLGLSINVIGPTGATGVTGATGTPNWQGIWSSSQPYNIGDAVFYNGSSYVCVVANSTISPTDPTYTDWTLLAQGVAGATGVTGAAGLNWLGTWTGMHLYNPGDAVYDNGSSYICLTGNYGDEPINNSGNWTLLAQQGAIGVTGETGTTGATGFLGAGASTGNTTYWDGTQWVLNSSFLYNDGTNVGIGVLSPQNNLDANGTFQSTNGNYELVNNNNLAGQGVTACGPSYVSGNDLYFAGVADLTPVGGSLTSMFGYNNLSTHAKSVLLMDPLGANLVYANVDGSSNNGVTVGYDNTFTNIGKSLQINDYDIALSYEDEPNSIFQTVDLTSNYGVQLSCSNYSTGSSSFFNAITLSNNNTNNGLNFIASTSGGQNSFSLSVASGLVVIGKDALSTSTGFSIQDNGNNPLLNVNNDGSIVTKGSLQLPLGATAASGDLLITDNSGNVSWATPSSLGIPTPLPGGGSSCSVPCPTVQYSTLSSPDGASWTANSTLLATESDVRINTSNQYNGAELSVAGMGAFTGPDGVQAVEVYVNYPNQGGIIQSGYMSQSIFQGGSATFNNNLLLLNPSGGNVGVGTYSPQGQLHVNNMSAYGTPGIISENGGNGVSNYNWSYVAADVDGNYNFTVDYNGSAYFGSYVGIGTSTPTEALDVNGKIVTTAFQLTPSGGSPSIDGDILTADASGNATWRNGSSTYWQTTGNSQTTPLVPASGGTPASGNYVGTSDATDLVLATNVTNGGTQGIRITSYGNVIIGTTTITAGPYTSSTYPIPNPDRNAVPIPELTVAGNIVAKGVIVTIDNWADNVFDTEYDLKPLDDVEQYVKENKHLPEIPSEKEILTDGVSLGQMNVVLVKKIEELTLYLIELKKENKEIKEQLSQNK